MDKYVFCLENGEIFEGNPDSNITEIQNEASFIAGIIFSELGSFDSLAGISESIEVEAFNEAAGSFFKKITDRMKAFLQKVMDFFKDLNAKIMSIIISKLMKLNKNAELKKDIKYYSLKDDSDANVALEDIKKFVDEAVAKSSSDIITGKEFKYSEDALALTSKISEDSKKINAEHFEKNSKPIPKGTKIGALTGGIIDAAKRNIANNNKVINAAKKASSIYDTITKKLESNSKGSYTIGGSRDTVINYGKMIVDGLNQSMAICRAINSQLFKNATTILNASVFGEKKEKEEK